MTPFVKWMGAFVLAAIGCLAAFFKIFDGSVAEGLKIVDHVVDQSQTPPQQFPPVLPPQVETRSQVVQSQVALPQVPQTSQGSQPEYRTIKFVLIDYLGTGQLKDSVNINMQGVGSATINLDTQRPREEVTGSAPSPGYYTYAVSATTTYAFGPVTCSGQGGLFLKDGGRYVLNVGPDAAGTGCILQFVPEN
jgi:hypothetical protein